MTATTTPTPTPTGILKLTISSLETDATHSGLRKLPANAFKSIQFNLVQFNSFIWSNLGTLTRLCQYQKLLSYTSTNYTGIR